MADRDERAEKREQARISMERLQAKVRADTGRPRGGGRAAGGRWGGRKGGGGGGVGEWDSLVGHPSKKAVKIIKDSNPSLHVVVVPEGSMVTMDMQPNRVRVWVDPNDLVTRIPRTG